MAQRRIARMLLILSAMVMILCASPQRTIEAAEKEKAAAKHNGDDEQPMSIFNDKLRRFKFRLEDTLVTHETVEAFLSRYRSGERASIIGAYADSKSNSLVVIAAPEAEDAIRVDLANWLVERQGLSPQPLKVQRRLLAFQRKDLLRDMAQIEILMAGVENAKAEQLRERLKAFADELKVTENQIEIVNRYIERSRSKPLSHGE